MDCLPMGKITLSISHHISIDKFFFIRPNVAHVFIKSMLDQIPQPWSDVDLIVSCWYERHSDRIMPVIDALIQCNFNTISLIADPRMRDHYKASIPITYINFFILQVELNKLPTTWNYDQHKGLLLTGKLDKFNRIVLLKKLYSQQLLTPNRLVWTVPSIQHQHIKIKSILADNSETDIFLKYCEANAINDPLGVYSTIANTPLVDKDSVDLFFQLSNYSIISETYFVEDEPCVTEKTFRAILNKHPFIMASAAGTLCYLRTLGFRTFENYLPNPNYDSIIDPDLRLAAIVTNIAAFPDILIKFRNRINEDVEHNYATLKNIAQADRHYLEELYSTHTLNLSELTDNFLISGTLGFLSAEEFNNFIQEVEQVTIGIQDKQWLDKYNQLKGADWPSIESRNEFNQLPNYVQQECITNFNFDSTTQLF